MLVTIALVSCFLAGFRNGEHRGLQEAMKQNDFVDVSASVTRMTANGKSTLAVATFQIPNGETFCLEGQDLGNLFVQITPTRIRPDTELTVQTKTNTTGQSKSTFNLNNIPALDAQQHLEELFSTLSSQTTAKSDLARNSVIVCTNSQQDLLKIRSVLEHEDRGSTIYNANILIGQKNNDGSRKYSVPQITTIENPASRVLTNDVSMGLTVELRFSDVR